MSSISSSSSLSACFFFYFFTNSVDFFAFPFRKSQNCFIDLKSSGLYPAKKGLGYSIFLPRGIIIPSLTTD